MSGIRAVPCQEVELLLVECYWTRVVKGWEGVVISSEINSQCVFGGTERLDRTRRGKRKSYHSRLYDRKRTGGSEAGRRDEEKGRLAFEQILLDPADVVRLTATRPQFGCNVKLPHRA